MVIRPWSLHAATVCPALNSSLLHVCGIFFSSARDTCRSLLWLMLRKRPSPIISHKNTRWHLLPLVFALPVFPQRLRRHSEPFRVSRTLDDFHGGKIFRRIRRWLS